MRLNKTIYTLFLSAQLLACGPQISTKEKLESSKKSEPQFEHQMLSFPAALSLSSSDNSSEELAPAFSSDKECKTCFSLFYDMDGEGKLATIQWPPSLNNGVNQINPRRDLEFHLVEQCGLSKLDAETAVLDPKRIDTLVQRMYSDGGVPGNKRLVKLILKCACEDKILGCVKGKNNQPLTAKFDSGIANNFSSKNEKTSPSESLLSEFNSSPLIQALLKMSNTPTSVSTRLDLNDIESTDSGALLHSFHGIKSHSFSKDRKVCGARLKFKAKASSSSLGSNVPENDTISLGFSGQNPSAFPKVSYYFGSTYVNPLLPNLGSLLEVSGFGKQEWKRGSTNEFVLDLSKLKVDNSIQNLIPEIDRLGFLDLMIQDDTAIDYLELSVDYCCRDEDSSDETFKTSFNPSKEPEVRQNILFVVDGSGSMSEEAGQIRKNLGSFLSGINLDPLKTRIAVTGPSRIPDLSPLDKKIYNINQWNTILGSTHQVYWADENVQSNDSLEFGIALMNRSDAYSGNRSNISTSTQKLVKFEDQCTDSGILFNCNAMTHMIVVSDDCPFYYKTPYDVTTRLTGCGYELAADQFIDRMGITQNGTRMQLPGISNALTFHAIQTKPGDGYHSKHSKSYSKLVSLGGGLNMDIDSKDWNPLLVDLSKKIQSTAKDAHIWIPNSKGNKTIQIIEIVLSYTDIHGAQKTAILKAGEFSVTQPNSSQDAQIIIPGNTLESYGISNANQTVDVEINYKIQ